MGRLKKVRIWSRTYENAKTFAEQQAKLYPEISIAATLTAKEAVEDADLITSLTSSATPILEGSWLKPGAHINAIGSCVPHKRELDTECVRKCTVFVDSKTMAVVEAGDLLIPIKEGAIQADHIKGEVGEILLGTVSGRTNNSEITLFKSLGLAVEDLVSSYYVYCKAKEQGKGIYIDL